MEEGLSGGGGSWASSSSPFPSLQGLLSLPFSSRFKPLPIVAQGPSLCRSRPFPLSLKPLLFVGPFPSSRKALCRTRPSSRPFVAQGPLSLKARLKALRRSRPGSRRFVAQCPSSLKAWLKALRRSRPGSRRFVVSFLTLWLEGDVGELCGARVELAVDAELAHAARDEMRVLRAKVQNQNRIVQSARLRHGVGELS